MIREKSRNSSELLVEFTNGDIARLDEVMKKYQFKDIQSFIRFSTSILLIAKDKEIKIKQDNDFILVRPSDTLLNTEK